MNLWAGVAGESMSASMLEPFPTQVHLPLLYCAAQKDDNNQKWYNAVMPEKNIDLKSKKLMFETFKMLKGGELEDLLMSLLSSAEVKDISRRLMAAKILKSGGTYQDVIDTMGMSDGTINKIHFKTKGSPIIRKLFGED